MSGKYGFGESAKPTAPTPPVGRGWRVGNASRRRIVGLVAAAGLVAGVSGRQVWPPREGRPAVPPPVDIDALRQAFVERGKIRYERLTSPDVAGDADVVLTDGWPAGSDRVVKLDSQVDWVNAARWNRSLNYSFHAWHWMAPVLGAFERTSRRHYLDWCVERAVSWARVFNRGDDRGTMAWYDMAIGLRAYRLAYLFEHAVRNRVGSDQVDILLTAIRRHQVELMAERAFNPGTNHGFYVAAGQLAMARRLAALPDMPALGAQGRNRMRIVSVRQFAADGGHREHSTDYHRMVLDAFRELVKTGLLTDREVLRRVILAEEVLGWFIQPDGEMVQVGDSSATHMLSADTETSSPTTRFLVTVGRSGRPHQNRLKVLPDSGYAIVRSPQPKRTDDHRRSSYLFLHAAYHSRAHKHADDLSIVWYDRQRPILIDAGRYGYLHKVLPEGHPLRARGFFYSAPERQYVESTRAHNTVAADGTDHDRLDRQPYGSAIDRAQERDGHFRLQAVVNHGVWRHRRDIVFRPGRWLLVTDHLTGLDRATHDFRVWWNFPADLHPRPDAVGRLAIDLPHSPDTLWVTELGRSRTIAPVSGQQKPLRGWRSRYDRQFTPAWSTGFEATDVQDHTFRTLFHFGRQPRATPFPHPFE